MRELKKICLLLTLLMTFSFTKAIADNKFYLVNTDLEPGTETTLEFALDNDQPFFGFQAEITLPPDVEIMKTADGKLDIK